MEIPKFDFGNLIYREHEGGNSFVSSIENVSEDSFLSYIESAKKMGFNLVEEHNFGEAEFKTMASGSNALFLSFYKEIGEMRIVEEEDCNFLSLGDSSKEIYTAPLLTHVDVEDYGLSYIIRLNDGRFIIFDGGWEFEPDADKIMNILSEQNVYEKPIIAAWIFTHPHLDHYRCFLSFYKKYKDRVCIEKFIYNFPDVTKENVCRFPALGRNQDYEKLLELYSYVEEIGAPVYRAHTGQVYEIGNATLEVLSSPDDCFFCPIEDFNTVSLIIKMTIEGQSILWSGDAFFGIAKLAERYGKYLKSDIFQIAHHGFSGGRAKEHKLIDPVVCLAPAFEADCFSYINIYYDYNRQLMFDLNVKEFIVGSSGNIVLNLPYAPCENAKELMFKKIDECQGLLGKKSWTFMDITEDEADFSILNTTHFSIPVFVNLYFDQRENMVTDIKLVSEPDCVTRVNLFDEKCADPDALYYNPRSLKKIGLKKGEKFTAVFKSRVPVVIKGKNLPDHAY